MQVYGDAWKPILDRHNAFQWDLDAWRSTWHSVCSPLNSSLSNRETSHLIPSIRTNYNHDFNVFVVSEVSSNIIAHTWRAFEFERAVWTSLGEWKYFIWKANNDDVTRGFFNKYCFLIEQTLVMSSLYETPIGDVITLYFLVLKCLHQFSCSSHQKQGSPNTINIFRLLLTENFGILQMNQVEVCILSCKMASPKNKSADWPLNYHKTV